MKMILSHAFHSVFIIIVLTSISVCVAGENTVETKDVVRFTTKLVSDPQRSSFKENFIHMPIYNDSAIFSFTFCFRIKPTSTITQCLFEQDDLGLGFKFDTEEYGFLILHKAFIMFEYQESLDPLKWYHVCLSYDSGHILLIINDKTWIDKEYSALKQLNDPELILSDRLTLGLCNVDSLDPLRVITKGLLTDFNMWSRSFSETTLSGFTKKCLPLSNEPDVVNWKILSEATKGRNIEVLSYVINDV